jgi:hypothetical protein
MKEHLMFAAKVALAILVINQIGPLQAVINKNYFASA